MLDLLIEAAEEGAPCPSNFALMDALNLASPDGVRKNLALLRQAGLIAVESEGQRRRITLLETGARTDWSRASGHARAGAAYAEGWGNGSDAILLRLADEGLDLATMATRLGRTPSSVRHRLRRLRAAADPIPTPRAEPAERPPSTANRSGSPVGDVPDPGPMRRDLITNDSERPDDERAQIAAFLAAGHGRKVPPAYVGEVRGGHPLTGVAPISAMARRVLLALEDTPRSVRETSHIARIDPLLMPEVLQELCGAGLIEQRRVRRRVADAPAETRVVRTPRAIAMIETLGLREACPGSAS
jgi:predicted transcriptional regulator